MRIGKKKWLILIMAFILLAGTAIYYAPHYLACADKPTRSDAIIVFEGDIARKKEAYELRKEGYAGYLIIPSSHLVLTPPSSPRWVVDTSKENAVIMGYQHFPRFYEHTHVEVLRAKRMMDALGLKSAIMVSSPYHMKRIRMISEKVFGEQARSFAYVPTRYEAVPGGLRKVNQVDWGFVIREYLKICWFGLYSLFVG